MDGDKLKTATPYTGQDSIAALISRCRDGDEKAMEAIYNKYKSSLYTLSCRFIGSRSLAEDMLQEIFIQIFQQIPKLRAIEAFHSWVYRIAVNTCISSLRKKARYKEVLLDDNIAETGKAPAIIKLWKHDLKQAIKTLPPKQRMVFLLHDVQGFTHQEIAGIMRLRQGTCKSQLFKARMKLRNYMSE